MSGTDDKHGLSDLTLMRDMHPIEVGCDRNQRKAAVGLVAEREAMVRDLRSAIVEADGCFEAALVEGWLEALAAGDMPRIRDIWERRLSLARAQFPAVLSKAEGRTISAEKERLGRIAWLEATYPRVFLETSLHERAIEWRRLTNAAEAEVCP